MGILSKIMIFFYVGVYFIFLAPTPPLNQINSGCCDPRPPKVGLKMWALRAQPRPGAEALVTP